MLVLGPSANDKLRVTTSAAGSLRVECSYIEIDVATPPVVQDVDSFTLAAITGATTTDVLAGVASKKRRIGFASFFNDHATIANVVTPLLTDGTNASPITQATLSPGESLVFTGAAWIHYDVNGVPVVASAKLDAKLVVSNDVTFATSATWADITGLTVALKAGKRYSFEAHIYHINNATTTGSQFGVNIGAAPTTLQIATIDTVTASVTASTHSAGAATARDTAATAQTTGSVAITMGILSGFIVPSADGTFAVRATSEVTVASGLIVKAGSWLRIWETDN